MSAGVSLLPANDNIPISTCRCRVDEPLDGFDWMSVEGK